MSETTHYMSYAALQEIHQYIRKDNVLEVQHLLFIMQYTNEQNDEILMKTVEYSAKNILKYLLFELHFDPNCREGEAIITACIFGDIECLKMLVLAGGDPGIRKNQSLLFAVFNNRIALFEELLKYPQVDIASNDNQAIITAAMMGHYQLYLRLLQLPEVNPAAQDNKALLMAAGNGHYKIVNHLMYDRKIACDNDMIVWCKINQERRMARYLGRYFP